MSQGRRAYVPGGVYFFTVVTYHRTPVFIDESSVEALRQAFRQVMAERPFGVDAIVVLPEHLHCIWREIKKSASRQISTVINTRHERLVWQRRFWEHVMRNDDDWRRHVDYIHYNPVKHRLVSRPAEWRWSSFGKAVRQGWYDAAWGAGEPDTIIGMSCE